MLAAPVRIPGRLVPGALRQLTLKNGNPWVLPGEFTVVRTVPETLRPKKMAAIIMTVTLVVGYAQDPGHFLMHLLLATLSRLLPSSYFLNFF